MNELLQSANRTTKESTEIEKNIKEYKKYCKKVL